MIRLWKLLKCLLGYHEVRCALRSVCGNPRYDEFVCVPCWVRGRKKAGDDPKALWSLMSRARWSRYRLPNKCKIIMQDQDPPPNPESPVRYVPSAADLEKERKARGGK